MPYRNAGATPLLVLALVAGLAYWGFVGFSEDEWSGFVYPDRNNLSRHQFVGVYGSLDDCRAAANAIIRQAQWSSSDYECGLNCEPDEDLGGLLVCEETAD